MKKIVLALSLLLSEISLGDRYSLMKIYRLLETIIFLLNNRSVTAKELAAKFEVSVRTIQRDMESLLVIGIPIESAVGANGGYCIHQAYKLKNQFVQKADFNLI